MSPAGHALDRRLYDLRVAYETVAKELADLEAEGTYAVLSAGALISGTTAARAHDALTEVDDVRLGLDVLGRMLSDVSALRHSGSLDDRAAAEVFTLLNSPSIVLPDRSVTPQDLLADLGAAVEPMREVVREVDAVWREFVPRLDRVTAEADRLAQAMPTFRSVDSARTALGGLAGRVIHDPLGATDELTEVESTLAAAAEAGTRAPTLRVALTAAARTVEELEALVAEGGEALTRSRTEIRDPGVLLDPVDPGIVTGERGLRPWLERLDRLVADGDIELADKGLASWQALAEKSLVTARQVVEANARPAERRQELRNLLRAARVKAGASGRAEDPQMTELARQADRALAVPCTLAAAEARVAEYVDELRRSPTPAQRKETSS